jgi:hypothetical protein
MYNDTVKTGSVESLAVGQRRGGGILPSTYMRFYYTHLVTYYKDDMLFFVLRHLRHFLDILCSGPGRGYCIGLEMVATIILGTVRNYLHLALNILGHLAFPVGTAVSTVILADS